jgi:hypothetical protein
MSGNGSSRGAVLGVAETMGMASGGDGSVNADDVSGEQDERELTNTSGGSSAHGAISGAAGILEMAGGGDGSVTANESSVEKDEREVTESAR